MGAVEKYILIINGVGFLVFVINYFFGDEDGSFLDTLITFTALAGGSVGIILAILIFCRDTDKSLLLSRVFVFSLLIIQIVIFLIYKGYIRSRITIAFWDFFEDHKLIVYYLLIINIITLIAFAQDKIAAAEESFRIKNVTLLGLAFIGGSIGALIAMYAFRHKTRKVYYTLGVPIIIVMQVVLIFYLMNAKF